MYMWLAHFDNTAFTVYVNSASGDAGSVIIGFKTIVRTGKFVGKIFVTVSELVSYICCSRSDTKHL